MSLNRFSCAVTVYLRFNSFTDVMNLETIKQKVNRKMRNFAVIALLAIATNAIMLESEADAEFWGRMRRGRRASRDEVEEVEETPAPWSWGQQRSAEAKGQRGDSEEECEGEECCPECIDEVCEGEDCPEAMDMDKTAEVEVVEEEEESEDEGEPAGWGWGWKRRWGW